MKLLAVDANSILNRAYYGIRPLTTKDGTYTHAIYGFLNILFKLLDEVGPDALAFAFDLRAPTFRHGMYDGYKAQRKGMPEELAQQVEPLKQILAAMGYRILQLEGYEADDILGTLAACCRAGGESCVIATGDRDSFQLIGGGVTVRLAYTRAGQSGAELIDEEEVMRRYGVRPVQMIDVKALMGDTSDNIPGVAGIGEKTALSLIQDFGSLDGVYTNLDDARIRPAVRAKLAAGRESAEMSRTLAAIECCVPLDCAPENFRPAERDDALLYELLERLELRTTIARLGLVSVKKKDPDIGAKPDGAADALPVYYNDTEKFLEQLGGERAFALLSWADGVPVAAAVLGKAVAVADEGCGELGGLLRALCKTKAAICLPNSKEWYHYLYKSEHNIQLVDFDPVLAGYLLTPLAASYALSDLCAGRALTPAALALPESLPGSAEKIARDAALLPALCEAQRKELAQNGQAALLSEIEQPLARVLASMEHLGFRLDDAGLTGYGRDLDRDIAELSGRIYFLAGGEFNINSPKQLGQVLFERLGLPARKKTKSGYSTDAQVLDSLRNYHPIVEEILSYRQLAKLKSTYIDGLLSQIEADGRVHTVFRQTETRTGRISSTEPNLQNIPVRTERGSQLRRFFVAQEGMLLVDADYSQIELRVLAHIANDAAMIEAFNRGDDIHTRTAAQVFDMPEDFVTPHMRSAAKAVNFGIVYGIGAFSLSQDIGVSVAEADRYIKSYLATYSGVAEYMEQAIAQAREFGYVTTLFGRRRPIPELSAQNRVTRAFGERVARNTPIQGTAADIIKLAMVRVFDRLHREGMRSRLILQVHDELIVEAPKEEAERAAAIMTEEMQNAAALSVVLVAEAHTGENWLEAK